MKLQITWKEKLKIADIYLVGRWHRLRVFFWVEKLTATENCTWVRKDCIRWCNEGPTGCGGPLRDLKNQISFNGVAQYQQISWLVFWMYSNLECVSSFILHSLPQSGLSRIALQKALIFLLQIDMDPFIHIGLNCNLIISLKPLILSATSVATYKLCVKVTCWYALVM